MSLIKWWLPCLNTIHTLDSVFNEITTVAVTNEVTLTCDGEVAGALGLLSSLIGQVDAEVATISLLGVSDPQGEDVVSLDHHVLAALEQCLLVLQPLGLRSLWIHLAVQDDFLSFFGLRVLQWRDDLQFFCRARETPETPMSKTFWASVFETTVINVSGVKLESLTLLISLCWGWSWI